MEYTVKDILNLQVAPALGCTEPVGGGGESPTSALETWLKTLSLAQLIRLLDDLDADDWLLCKGVSMPIWPLPITVSSSVRDWVLA